MLIAGVDEAGRGPLAGPVVAAAVILDPKIAIDGITDSKKLSSKQREKLYGIICKKAIAWGIGSATPVEIDKLNILQATLLAMKRAIIALQVKPVKVLVDGMQCPSLPYPATAIIKGDSKIESIGAASILAKVTRDRYLVELDKQYPEYGFAAHKGYPTKKHFHALQTHGPCPEHRRSFKPVADCLVSFIH